MDKRRAICAAVAAIAVTGCGGDDGTPPPPVAAPTAGIEHVRIVQTIGAERTVMESWEHRPADGCWSSRVRGRTATGEPFDILSTVVRDDGTPRRVSRVTGPLEPQAGDACSSASRTVLQVLRGIVASGTLREAGTATVRGRTVAVFTGPPDAVLLGMEDPSRSTAVGGVTAQPAGARMRLLWDTARRMPVRVTTPAAVIALDGAESATVPPMRTDYLVAEELPVTPATMRVFTPPGS